VLRSLTVTGGSKVSLDIMEFGADMPIAGVSVCDPVIRANPPPRLFVKDIDVRTVNHQSKTTLEDYMNSPVTSYNDIVPSHFKVLNKVCSLLVECYFGNT
jgi:hypothetical protein